ncbi:U-scoloptoxin(01)-Cw1a-like, partial [Oratosquilla oratoria]|uniref:U-scoloptoxin(01)-Cw1a-like n=1 Tax=Oratosquilla oratoria TaxID=337810 RepID=UPI003F762AB6
LQMARFLLALLALAAAVYAQGPYQFSDGYLEILGGEPAQSFTCEGRRWGYYADVANDCRVFHVCFPMNDEEGNLIELAHFSFFCGNQTVFSQESLTCAHPQDAFPCDQAESLFEISNADLGRIPETNSN